jgi:hypothetical protein
VLVGQFWVSRVRQSEDLLLEFRGEVNFQ